MNGLRILILIGLSLFIFFSILLRIRRRNKYTGARVPHDGTANDSFKTIASDETQKFRKKDFFNRPADEDEEAKRKKRNQQMRENQRRNEELRKRTQDIVDHQRRIQENNNRMAEEARRRARRNW